MRKIHVRTFRRLLQSKPFSVGKELRKPTERASNSEKAAGRQTNRVESYSEEDEHVSCEEKNPAFASAFAVM